MTDEAVNPLRQRMIEDMTIRKFAPKTQHDYVQRVKHFAAFPRPLARYRDLRRRAPLSAASGSKRRGVPTLNQSYLDAAVLFQVTLGAPRS